MNAILLIFAIIFFSGVSFCKEKEFYKDYMSIEKTTTIKGIFVTLIIMSHYCQYLDSLSQYDNLYWEIRMGLKQLVVVMFLFYSGYGIYKKIEKNQISAIKQLPAKIGLILWRTDIAVLIFTLLFVALKKTVSIKQFLLSLICWESIGNNTWYIFAILVLYFITYFSYMISNNKIYAGIVLLTIITIGLIYVLSLCRNDFWYNTLLCYPMGMWYGCLEKKITKQLFKSDISYFLCLSIIFVAWSLLYNRRDWSVLYYELWAVSFSLLVVLITMKVCINNHFLQFMGKHIMAIYLLERIPMIILDEKGTLDKQPYISFITCFFIIIFVVLCYEKMIKMVEDFARSKFHKSLE